MRHPEHTAQRVLVIDDDSVMRDILAMVLGAEARELRFARSGEDALALLQSLPSAALPNVVLMDLHMPGLSGSALATGLRDLLPQARLIAMSATAPSPAEPAAFDSFLGKPFTAADFDSAVLRAGDAHSTHLPIETLLDPGIYGKLLQIMPSDQLDLLYTMCLDDIDLRTARMTAAIASGDATCFIDEAHAIKGSCGMLGISHLQSLAARMEAGGLGSTSLLTDLALAMTHLRRMLDERKVTPDFP
jgi:CheY-like chemotaxis protein